MVKHEAFANLQSYVELGKVFQDWGRGHTSSIRIAYHDDAGKIGELKVGKSGVIWYPTKATYGGKISIEKLGKFIMEEGEEVER